LNESTEETCLAPNSISNLTQVPPFQRSPYPFHNWISENRRLRWVPRHVFVRRHHLLIFIILVGIVELAVPPPRLRRQDRDVHRRGLVELDGRRLSRGRRPRDGGNDARGGGGRGSGGYGRYWGLVEVLRNVSEVVRGFVPGKRGEYAVRVVVVVVVVMEEVVVGSGRGRGGRGRGRSGGVVVVWIGVVVAVEENDVVFVELIVGGDGRRVRRRVRRNAEVALCGGELSGRKTVRAEWIHAGLVRKGERNGKKIRITERWVVNGDESEGANG